MDVKSNAHVKRRDWTVVGVWMVMVLGLTVFPLGHVQNANAEFRCGGPANGG